MFVSQYFNCVLSSAEDYLILGWWEKHNSRSNKNYLLSTEQKRDKLFLIRRFFLMTLLHHAFLFLSWLYDLLQLSHQSYASSISNSKRFISLSFRCSTNSSWELSRSAANFLVNIFWSPACLNFWIDAFFGDLQILRLIVNGFFLAEPSDYQNEHRYVTLELAYTKRWQSKYGLECVYQYSVFRS